MKIKFIYRFLYHFFTARNTKGHGIHSPFVYNFVKYVIYEKHPYYSFLQIEEIRKSLLHNNKEINVNDFGAGNSRLRRVSDIAFKSVKRKKYAQLFYRIIHYFKFQNILELGTSFGITTAYLASASETSKVITLEGCIESAEIARQNFGKLGLKNINIIEGNIDYTLKITLDSFEKFDFIFIDANHRKEPLLNYFNACLSAVHNNSVIIIDDIHWSDEMIDAWKNIKSNDKVTSTIDLFESGIVFFNPILHKKHYKIRF